MVFSSTLFLFYFLPGFLLIYYAVPTRFKNPVALVASLLFYAWGGLGFLALFLASVVVNFILIRRMELRTERWQQRIFLIISILLNVGMLFYFKYANFFLDNASAVRGYFGGPPLTWEKVMLPIGISFFTFEKLTYTIDVYRGVNKPLKSFWDFLLYIMLFPKMIAGPIVRFHEIAGQLTDRAAFDTVDQKLAGAFRFVLGLAKKVLIANVLGEQADVIFHQAPPRPRRRLLARHRQRPELAHKPDVAAQSHAAGVSPAGFRPAPAGPDLPFGAVCGRQLYLGPDAIQPLHATRICR